MYDSTCLSRLLYNKRLVLSPVQQVLFQSPPEQEEFAAATLQTAIVQPREKVPAQFLDLRSIIAGVSALGRQAIVLELVNH